MNDKIETQMRELMRRLNVSPRGVRDDQYVQVSMSAIHAPSVVGFRREEDGGPFTGWEIIATADRPETARYGYYSVRELAALRPSWLVALHLPVGWAFRFDGETLVDCVSDKGETFPLNMPVSVS